MHVLLILVYVPYDSRSIVFLGASLRAGVPVVLVLGSMLLAVDY